MTEKRFRLRRRALQPEDTPPQPPQATRPRATARAPSGRVVTKRARPTGPSIARVSLPTVDLGASDRFDQLIGLTRKAAAKDGSKLLLSDGAGFELELIRSPGPVTRASLVVRFATGAVGEVIERLLSAGLEPLSAADDLITCVDPSGHAVVVREGARP